MKRNQWVFWTSTIIIILFEGLIPLIAPQSESVKAGAIHLGYPVYFGKALIVFKLFGVAALAIPQIPKRIKEWAYAGFTFDLIFAFLSHFIIDGPGFQTFFPIIIMAILFTSYFSYHKLNSSQLN